MRITSHTSGVTGATGETQGIGKRVRAHNQKGQTLVEFALVAMVFFSLAFVLIDYSWLMFGQMNMQDAVREAGRFASTGNHNPNPAGGTYSRLTSINQVLDSYALPGIIKNCTISISSAAGGAGSAGGPGDTVTVKATCAIPPLTPGLQYFPPNFKFNFVASSSFVNEPFPPSETT